MKKAITLLAISMLMNGGLLAQTEIKKEKKQETKAKEGKYRLVIEFISKGGGVDYKTQEKINEFIEKHPKKPAFEVQRWGREGEVDYYFHLKELSHHEQKAFIEEIHKLIPDKEMVLVHENHQYVKKGR